MAAVLAIGGTSKSGSPIDRLIGSFIFAARSKTLRMPEASTANARREMYSQASGIARPRARSCDIISFWRRERRRRPAPRLWRRGPRPWPPRAAPSSAAGSSRPAAGAARRQRRLRPSLPSPALANSCLRWATFGRPNTLLESFQLLFVSQLYQPLGPRQNVSMTNQGICTFQTAIQATSFTS